MNKYKMFFITILLAYCSISYELILANTLSFLTGDQIYWQTITVGIFILGLGFGSFYAEKYINHPKTLEYVELGLSLLGIISVPIIIVVTATYKYYEFLLILKGTTHAWQLITHLKVIFLILVQSLSLSIGFLSGFEIPLIIGITKAKEGVILGLNYIGTLIGSLVLSLYLMNHYPIMKIVLIIVSLNMIAYIVLVNKFFKKILGVIIILLYIYADFNYLVNLERYYYNFFYSLQELNLNVGVLELAKKSIQSSDVVRIKSRYQNIDLVNKDHVNIYGETKHSFNVFIDTNYQFGSENEHLYHEGFAHVPILLNNKIPKKVLILGAGDGLLLRELLKYPDIESITQIELDEKMVEISNNNSQILELNKGSMFNNKLHMIIGDGFSFVRNTNEKFDAIYIDFPYPKSHDLSKLYSKEFYGFIYKVLNDDGFATLDAPLSEKSKNEQDANYDKRLKNNSIILSSIYYAGFKTLIPYLVKEESFVFFNKNNKFNKENLNRPNKFFSNDTQNEILKIKNQHFMHLGIKKQYINSVFKPIVGTSHNPFESN